MTNGTIVGFGEILMRLSAANGTIADSTGFDACYGGTEANVLACLSAFGHKTRYLTALPDGSLGDAAAKTLERYGIDVSRIKRGGDTLGMYFSEDGGGSRGANVLYYRKHSEFTRLGPGAFDVGKVFAGVKLFHISGISFALSDSSRALAFGLMRAARARGITVSFDFNYRKKLWDIDMARPILAEAAGLADVLLASDLDLETFLNATREGFFEKFPACEYLFLRNRTIESADRHAVSVDAFSRGGESFALPKTEFAVTEKIGGGDAFDGGILHGLLAGMSLKETVRFGAAAFIKKHSVRGDIFDGGEAEVKRLLDSGVV